MNKFFEELTRYFETTPQNKILDDWSKSEKFDNIGPTIEDFINHSQIYHACTSDPNDWDQQEINNQLNPKFTSGFFINLNLTKNAKGSFFNCNI